MRISNDYATGAAGIGLFFTRLLRLHRRLFVDLDLDAVGKNENHLDRVVHSKSA